MGDFPQLFTQTHLFVMDFARHLTSGKSQKALGKKFFISPVQKNINASRTLKVN